MISAATKQISKSLRRRVESSLNGSVDLKLLILHGDFGNGFAPDRHGRRRDFRFRLRDDQQVRVIAHQLCELARVARLRHDRAQVVYKRQAEILAKETV